MLDLNVKHCKSSKFNMFFCSDNSGCGGNTEFVGCDVRFDWKMGWCDWKRECKGVSSNRSACEVSVHIPNEVVQLKKKSLWLGSFSQKLHTNCHSLSPARCHPFWPSFVLAALYICTRLQLQYMSWKEGLRPRKSYFCMLRLVAFILH